MNNLDKQEVFEMPMNKFNLKNGSILVSAKDQFWAGLKEGDTFSISYDGECVKSGGLSWDVEQICDEIDQGFWLLSSNLEKDRGIQDEIKNEIYDKVTRVLNERVLNENEPYISLQETELRIKSLDRLFGTPREYLGEIPNNFSLPMFAGYSGLESKILELIKLSYEKNEWQVYSDSNENFYKNNPGHLPVDIAFAQKTGILKACKVPLDKEERELKSFIDERMQINEELKMAKNKQGIKKGFALSKATMRALKHAVKPGIDLGKFYESALLETLPINDFRHGFILTPLAIMKIKDRLKNNRGS